jgi:hypothetical protein
VKTRLAGRYDRGARAHLARIDGLWVVRVSELGKKGWSETALGSERW